MTPDRAARRVMAHLSTVRRGHEHHESAFGEIYMWVLGLLMLAAMVGNGWADVVGRGTCTGQACVHGASPSAAGAMALLLLAGAWRALVTVGPVGADAAHLTWVLSSPLPRRPVLRARAWGAAVASALVGALAGPTVLATAGLAITPDAVAWGCPAGAAAGVATTGLVALAQSSETGRTRAAVAPLGLVTCGLVLGLLALTGVGPTSPAAGPAGSAAWWVAAGTALVTAVGTLLVAHADARIDRIDGAELRRAGQAATAAHDSALMMDASALANRSARARLSRRGTFRSGRGRGTGLSALVRQDLARVGRQRDRLARGIPLLLGTALLAGLAPPVVTLPALGLAASVLARSLGDGLISWSLSGGLRRSLPWPDATVRLAWLVAPVLATAVWSGVATLVVGLSWWACPALVLSATASLLAASRPVDLAMMAVMIPTPFGMAPAGAAGALRGYELAPLAMIGPALAPGATGLLLPAAVLLWQWRRASR